MKKLVRVNIYLWDHQKKTLDEQAKANQRFEGFGRASSSALIREIIEDWTLELDKDKVSGA